MLFLCSYTMQYWQLIWVQTNSIYNKYIFIFIITSDLSVFVFGFIFTGRNFVIYAGQKTFYFWKQLKYQ